MFGELAPGCAEKKVLRSCLKISPENDKTLLASRQINYATSSTLAIMLHNYIFMILVKGKNKMKKKIIMAVLGVSAIFAWGWQNNKNHFQSKLGKVTKVHTQKYLLAVRCAPVGPKSV
jgi:hypothetical protein